MQKEILKGRYRFVFGSNAKKESQKFLKTMTEPMCFYMYKRGDLRTKINHVEHDKIKVAKRFFTLVTQLKRDIIQ
jgi:hypothetical protein